MFWSRGTGDASDPDDATDSSDGEPPDSQPTDPAETHTPRPPSADAPADEQSDVRAWIAHAARGLFPDRTVQAVTTRSSRPGNTTGFVRFADHSPAYVKTATNRDRLVRETAATRFAAARTAAPTVVAADATLPALATAPAAGVPATRRWDDREPTLRAAGRAVADLHATQFDTPGVVTGGDADALDLDADSWTETLAATIESREADWLPDRFADCAGRLPRLVRQAQPTLGDTAPRLCHDDLTRSNVRVDPPGLIDFERALVGDPALDVVCAVTHLIDQPDVSAADRPRLVAAFHDGYRDVAGALPATLERHRPLYRAVASLLTLQAFDSLLADTDRPADDLEREVRATFDRRVARARDDD